MYLSVRIIKDSRPWTLVNIRYKTLSFILPVYAFFAAALPVWLLLAPRDYLSTFMKIGVFAALIIGVFIVNPVDSNASIY